MQHRHLLWVRHALPHPDPTTPTETWPLTDAGRKAAANLARSLADIPQPVAVISSDERKAIETAEQFTETFSLSPARAVADLREVQRPWIDGDYRAAAREYLRFGSAPGWEPRAAVLQRMSRALAKHWTEEGTTIVVGHGLAMSIWAADAVAGLDAVAFWDSLTFPDAWLFTENGGAFRRLAQER